MTTTTGGTGDAFATERARAAATLAALHAELDMAVAECERLRAEIAELADDRNRSTARAEAVEAEIAALRLTRAVRWATWARERFGR